MSEKHTRIDGMDGIKALSKDQMIHMIEILAKNTAALDGTWFQAIERDQGMDDAIKYDIEAWKRFTISEGRRIKKFLDLDEHPGLAGLKEALKYKGTSLANVYEFFYEEDALIFRIVDCRVQNARERKGMGFHPCKPVGLVEYAGFAKTIDDRISCECLSCFPDMNDTSCNCSWKFRLNDTKN